MKRTLIAGLAMAALVFGGLGLAGTAQAAPPRPDPPMPGGTGTWCPGQPLPQQWTMPTAEDRGSYYSAPPVTWDMSVCHDWYYNTFTPDGAPGIKYIVDPVEGENPHQCPGCL